MNGKAPDAFRTISEVADWLDVNAHVLRFWESKFTQVKPVKRAGGRRYYRRSDMELLGGIQKLLHEDGMTIKGVQKVLREQGIRAVCAMSKSIDDVAGLATDDQPEIAETAEPASQTAAQGQAEPVEPVAESDDGPDLTEDEETKAPAESESSVAAAPAPPAGTPTGAPEVLPLFTHRDPPEETSDEAAPAEAAELSQPEAAPEPDEPAATPDEPHIEQTQPEPTPGPIIAPLPGPELTVAEALSRLAPLQVDPALLRPIHARLVALRDRMDTSG